MAYSPHFSVFKALPPTYLIGELNRRYLKFVLFCFVLKERELYFVIK